MPDIRQLLELYQFVSRQDWAAAKAAALKIAEKEQQRGHVSAARKLRDAIGPDQTNGAQIAPQTLHNGEFMLSKALVRCTTSVQLHEIQLSSDNRNTLNEILEEWNGRVALNKAGINRRSRLLFHGPPGCGKTVTALALASEMNLPAYVVRFDSLIGSYLGQTATRLRELFQYASHNRCLVFLDEIDVLGKRRGSQMDVGELDRIVVGLMQEMDLSLPRGLLIGASNLPRHLDDALWRRFDAQLEFKAPTRREIDIFMQSVAKRFHTRLSSKIREDSRTIKDYASAERLIVDEARRTILRDYHKSVAAKK